MTYTIIFVITVIIISGVIAYSGDILGRRMGKRRLSLFGLRPRYTAIVMTTITGMLIAVLTISALLAMSSGLRKIFFEAEKLMRDNIRYKSINEQLKAQNRAMEKLRLKLTREIAEKNEAVRKAKADVAAAQAQRNEAMSKVLSLEREISDRLAELKSLKTASRLTNQKLKEVSSRLSELGAELAERKQELADRTKELEYKQRDLDEKTKELLSKTTALAKAEEDIKSAEAAIRLIEAQRLKLIETTEKLLTGDVVLLQGQELARRVIDSSLSADKIRDQLIKLLDDASKEASASGAGASGGERAIRLVFEDKSSGMIIDDENLCIDAAVNAIIEQGHERPGKSVLVRIVVISNTVEGSRAAAVLNMFWNNLAFSKGDLIAARVIDGSQSEGRTLLSVMDLLRQDVRASAENRGVVPVSGRDPDRAAQPINEEQLERVMKLVNTIRAQDKKVEVKAIARSDIYQAGPLTLDDIDFAVSTTLRASNR